MTFNYPLAFNSRTFFRRMTCALLISHFFLISSSRRFLQRTFLPSLIFPLVLTTCVLFSVEEHSACLIRLIVRTWHVRNVLAVKWPPYRSAIIIHVWEVVVHMVVECSASDSVPHRQGGRLFVLASDTGFFFNSSGYSVFELFPLLFTPSQIVMFLRLNN